MTAFFSTVHTVFTGIVLQAVPFMLLGALLSSALYAFVPDRLLIKLFPQKYGIGFLTALFAGALFPVCECAAVPLMRSLIKKGVAMPIAVTFMLASPIVNPISIVSTLYAFPQQPSVAFYRLCFGLLIAFAIGLLLLFYPEEKYLKEDFDREPAVQPHSLGDAAAAFRLATGRSVQNSRSEPQSDNFSGITAKNSVQWLQAKVYALLMHTCSEFLPQALF